MRWYDFLDCCELEKVLLRSLFMCFAFWPLWRSGTFAQEAVDEFRHMWE